MAELYYRSIKQYRAGQLAEAREGFRQVLGASSLPAPMKETAQTVPRPDRAGLHPEAGAVRLASAEVVCRRSGNPGTVPWRMEETECGRNQETERVLNRASNKARHGPAKAMARLQGPRKRAVLRAWSDNIGRLQRDRAGPETASRQDTRESAGNSRRSSSIAWMNGKRVPISVRAKAQCLKNGQESGPVVTYIILIS